MKKPSFMQKIYGFDLLFFAVSALCLILAVLTVTVLKYIPHLDTGGVLSALGLTMLINCARVFSKEKAKREHENIRFKLWLNSLRSKRRPAAASHIEVPSLGEREYRCSCGRKLDVPSQHGQHIVMCPTCGKRCIIKV